jgi:hypothetical protein
MHLRSPRHYAETIIPEVIEELDSGHYQWTGIVFGDFLSSENPNGESLTHKIVDINFA